LNELTVSVVNFVYKLYVQLTYRETYNNRTITNFPQNLPVKKF